MVTVNEAKKLLERNTSSLEPIDISLENSRGYVIANDIFAPINLPPLTSSAMDGYAVRFSDIKSNLPVKLRISGEVKAGYSKTQTLGKGCAIRIYTGAPVPSGADCVAIQEDTEEANGHVIIKRRVSKHDNIRREGEEAKKGEAVIKRGTFINPPVVGLLSIMGIPKVIVIRKPRTGLIVTGDEIVSPGNILKPGQVYDSNSFSISSALMETGIDEIVITRQKDSLPVIEKAFDRAFRQSDIVIFTGGISVGKYDYVSELLKQTGVETIFYKVEQKPGKPLYLGKYRGKIVFGLPGNPVSSLVCFYEYVLPAVRKMMGLCSIYLKEETAILAGHISVKPGKVNFLRGKFNKGAVEPLKHQESHMLSSFAESNCLIIVPQHRKVIKNGERVKIHMLPG
jgi:molybdopterin molybdotransferase